MTNTVIIKRSSAPNAVPTSGQLVHGELAINYLDGNVFYKNASNNVVVIASNQFVSVFGNVTGGNLNTTGNVTGDNFIGNGANIVSISTNTVTANNVVSTFALNLNSSGNGNILINADGTGIAKITGNLGFVVPVGNTQQRPDYPNYIAVDAGTTRFNSTINAMEVWTGTAWQTIGQTSNVTVADQQITPDGLTSTFTLNQSSTAAAVLVTMNGVSQIPNVAYTVTGNSLTFMETPLSSDIIDIRFLTSTVTPGALFNTSANSAIQVTDTPQINFVVDNVTRAAVTAAGIMDISTGHSLKLPSYSTAAANALGNVANGELIYVSDGDSGSPCLAVYSSGAWRRVALGATISI